MISAELQHYNCLLGAVQGQGELDRFAHGRQWLFSSLGGGCLLSTINGERKAVSERPVGSAT